MFLAFKLLRIPLRHDVGRELRALENQKAIFNELLEGPPEDFGCLDIGALNLLCAPSLLGSEKFDISRCLARLDRLTAFVKAETERSLPRYRSDPNYGNSEAKWRMALLVTLVKRDFGARYNPLIVRDKAAGTLSILNDSRDLFINGLLDDNPERRWGTCASIPVLIAAVARRLRYPVGLAVAGRHIYAKWEGAECFNIEASNPKGMTVNSDEEYRQKIPEQNRSNKYYLRTLSPAEEFGLYLSIRTEALLNLARYDETFLWSARSLQFAPNDPAFPQTAHYALALGLRHRMWRMFPRRKIPSMDSPAPINAGELLSAEELCLYSSILGHWHESIGEIDVARDHYEWACRANFHGNNEQRDLQRFLRQHDLRRRSVPLMPPKGGPPRRMKLSCEPHREAEVLLQLAYEFETDRQFVKARDALHDLYMFDPSDAGVFNRVRALERCPQFQGQLKGLIAKRRNFLRASAFLSKRFGKNENERSDSDVIQSFTWNLG